MTGPRLLQRLRRPGSGGRAWLCALLALALAIRLLVPQGWMPNGAGGVMMCSGSAPVAMASAMHGGQEMPAGHGQDHPCPFAALGLAAAPPAAVAPVLPPAAVTATGRSAAHAIAVGRGLAAPPPPATGPPAFA